MARRTVFSETLSSSAMSLTVFKRTGVSDVLRGIGLILMRVGSDTHLSRGGLAEEESQDRGGPATCMRSAAF